MKKFIRIIISTIAALSRLILNRKVVDLMHTMQKEFYSAWVKHDFQSCGQNCFFGRFTRLRGAKYIVLGSNLYVGTDVAWEVYDEYLGQRFTPLLSFGNGSSFGDGGHISCVNRIAIGNGVRIGRKAFITDNSHGASDRSLLDTPPNKRPLYSKGPVTIEDNVWIGEMTCIMPGVTIGRGTIIGANSVVTQDIPAYCVAVGSPARVIKQLEQPRQS